MGICTVECVFNLLVIRLWVGCVASVDVRLEPLTCKDEG